MKLELWWHYGWKTGKLSINYTICIVRPDRSVGKKPPAMQETPVQSWVGGSAGERISYPFQHSWASLVAQLVKYLPANWETWVRFLGWEDPLEKGKDTSSSILAWRIPWSHTNLSDFDFHFIVRPNSKSSRDLSPR